MPELQAKKQKESPSNSDISYIHSPPSSPSKESELTETVTSLQSTISVEDAANTILALGSNPHAMEYEEDPSDLLQSQPVAMDYEEDPNDQLQSQPVAVEYSEIPSNTPRNQPTPKTHRPRHHSPVFVDYFHRPQKTINDELFEQWYGDDAPKPADTQWASRQYRQDGWGETFTWTGMMIGKRRVWMSPNWKLEEDIQREDTKGTKADMLLGQIVIGSGNKAGGEGRNMYGLGGVGTTVWERTRKISDPVFNCQPPDEKGSWGWL